MKIPYVSILALLLTAATAPSLRAGDAKENYQKNCAKCHGVDGKGHTKMGEKLHVKDYSDPKVQSEFKDDKLAEIIKNGVKGEDGKTRMKPHGELFSAQEIQDLVKYIRSLKK